MSDDDWRGLDKIRIPKPKSKESLDASNALAQRISHARRRAEGKGQARSGGLWARQIRSWSIAASIKGGME